MPRILHALTSPRSLIHVPCQPYKIHKILPGRQHVVKRHQQHMVKDKGGPRHDHLTSNPRAPCPGVGMKAMSATMAVRTLHEGCHASGW